ncbi:uncharacterized protein LOC18448313 [Amborella trichopoda]|uniref:DEUBAD domain-containing protein n=1 Tax=Amborella trichopoda TaxID=13333 RepID=U5DEP4_AMBTC|nr:uncharacterized protein LOC18448313 [Amborella trichopoda]XP_020531783.1 uncharacterized protein LOC18448313 [Amborella trichopoda]ERN19912.1 hypothetical protein AMTR_s00071p00082570 [Amborella trichopoda]|eukprot:XP_006858445.1 uncharacterized protein LOC18448313 [Amborella trichopoda]
MGNLKIRQRVPSKGAEATLFAQLTTDGEHECEENILNGEDSGLESDDFTIADVGCEFAMLSDQIFSIPYELFDLPDLKEILSLESWNSCLTEEERFSLSAYLPDMDQETFRLTMKELLNGEDLYFGSPLTDFFNRLKGGFFPPPVTHNREGLLYLQRKLHYVSLRRYQEQMLETFLNMKKKWEECRPGLTIEERIRIWNICKTGYPSSRTDHGQEDQKMLSGSFSNKNKPMMPYPTNGMVPVAVKSSGKGVLKLKTTANNSIQTGIEKLEMTDTRPRPKGVLKIVPRGHLTRTEPPRAVPFKREKGPLPPAFIVPKDPRWGGELLKEEDRNDGKRFSEDLHNPRRYYRGSSVREEHFYHDELWGAPTKQKNELHSSIYRYPSEPYCDLEEHQITTLPLDMGPVFRVRGESQGHMSEFHSEEQPVYSRSNHLVDSNKYYDSVPRANDGNLHKKQQNRISEGPEGGYALPKIYKRKKSSRNLEPVDFARRPTGLGEPEEINYQHGEKAKSVKIRIKKWKD